MTNTRIRISALLLAISGLLTPHPAAFGAGKAPKTHELTFSGKATPEQYYVPVYTSFTVPEGIVKISVTQHLGSGEARPGNLDLGIFDERGAGFEGPGFRGWSGGARRSFEIGETEATPGYLAGRINPGRWTVIQMPTTAGRTTDWTLKITLTEGPRAKKLPAPSYAAPQLNDKPGWYRIAPHVHTVHSDGRLTPAEVIALGKASGLDGIVSTDHNTTSALLHWGEVQDLEFLVINGVEVTYGQGHWNIFGLDPHAWIDFRIHHNDTLRYRKVVAKARKAGRLLVATPPYNLDFLYDVTPMDGIEVWNSAWSPANERAVELWHTLLVGGNRKFAVASTDFHRGGNIAPHGRPRRSAFRRGGHRRDRRRPQLRGAGHLGRDRHAGPQFGDARTACRHRRHPAPQRRDAGRVPEQHRRPAAADGPAGMVLRHFDRAGHRRRPHSRAFALGPGRTPRRGRQHDRPDQPHLYPASADHAVPAARIKRSYRHKKAPSSDGAFA